MEDDNFDNLPVEERCVHKSWKARISGYTSTLRLFDEISDEKSDEWNEYVHIVKNILQESSDPALEKGLEVVQNFVLKAAAAGKIVGHVVAGLVKKCVASPRARIRDLTLQIFMICVEIGKQKVVTDELLNGTKSKNPKISVGCIQILTEVIRSFGTMVVPVEGLLPKLPVLLEDRDQKVRNEAKSLTVEIYRWLGDELRAKVLKPDILKAQKLAEIVSEIAKIKDRSPAPLRFLRSQVKVHLDNSNQEDLGVIGTVDETTENSVEETSGYSIQLEIKSRIPEEFYVKIKSPKWSERKEALEMLEKLLSEEGKVQNDDFNEIIDLLVNLISKDANIIVVCLAVKCVMHFAEKLGGDFAQYSLKVFRALVEKLKERKPCVVQTLRQALDAVTKSSTLGLFVDDFSESLKSKNPNVKSESALLLSRCFSRLSQTSLSSKPLRPLFPVLVACLSDQDPSVRDGSAKALGVAMIVLGEKGLSPLIKDLDKMKLFKIKECAESFLDETKNAKSKSSDLKKQTVRTNSNTYSKLSSERPTKQLCRKNVIEAPKISQKESTLPKSSHKTVTEAISEDTLKALSDKDWSVRFQAILKIQEIVNSLSDIPVDLGDLSSPLKTRMLDSNPKISAASINLVASLAKKIGPPFKEELRTLLPALLKAVGDVKGSVRDVAVTGLTEIGEFCGYGEILQSEFLLESLKSGSNTTKAKLWRWLAENLPKITLREVPQSDLEKMLPVLFAGMEDKNAEVRSEASNSVDGFAKVLTLEKISSYCDKFYRNSNHSVVKIIREKQRVGLHVEAFETPSKRTGNTKSKSIRDPSPVVSRKKVKFVDVTDELPLLDVNNLKNQRIIDEQKHKIAKWDFVTPRTEFVELLKGLMSAANFSQELTEFMFHSDFRCHVKAMDLLTEEISRNSVGIVCNLDLILRWLTLKFFDGNPTVLSKSLDFMITALRNLSKINYCLLDSEAVAFVPYLVLKLGDSKENIQTKVKEILVNLTSVYPVSKLKKFVMDGTRSNIARQRSNCLDVIISYIESYGDSLYIGEIDSMAETTGKLLKDRDPGVKKKAFILAGMLYEREGEKIMKFIEKHAGVDFLTIEGKIRKYVVTKPNLIENQFTALDAEASHPVDLKISAFDMVPAGSQNSATVSEPELELTEESKLQPMKFHWDADLVQEIDALATSVVPPAETVDIDLEFMKDDPKPLNWAFQLPESTTLLYSTNTPRILTYIESIADDDLVSSKNGVQYIDRIINSGRGKDVEKFSDILIQKLTQNLENLNRKHFNEVLENYGSTLTLLTSVCSENRFVRWFSEDSLYDTLKQLLLIISNYKFEGKEYEIYRKTVNTIILKILENSVKTSLVCALLRMLGDTREIEGTMVSGKLNELCMKCLWKLNRSQATWDDELDYKVIFSVIRKFLSGFPNPLWKSRPGDMSLRTVKTFLKTMVRLRGERVLDDVGADDASQLRRYLSKLVKYERNANTAHPRNDNNITTVQ